MSVKKRERYYKKLEQRNFNDKLTYKGKKDTAKLANDFINKNIVTIYTSPFLRCVQTAKILAKKLNAKIIIDNRLSERGTYNNIRHLNEKEFNYLWDNYLNINFETNLIETAKHFVSRIKEFIFEVNSKHKNENVILVGHSCLTYAINAVIDGIPKSGFLEHAQLANNVIKEIDIK